MEFLIPAGKVENIIFFQRCFHIVESHFQCIYHQSILFIDTCLDGIILKKFDEIVNLQNIICGKGCHDSSLPRNKREQTFVGQLLQGIPDG